MMDLVVSDLYLQSLPYSPGIKGTNRRFRRSEGMSDNEIPHH